MTTTAAPEKQAKMTQERALVQARFSSRLGLDVFRASGFLESWRLFGHRFPGSVPAKDDALSFQ